MRYLKTYESVLDKMTPPSLDNAKEKLITLIDNVDKSLTVFPQTEKKELDRISDILRKPKDDIYIIDDDDNELYDFFCSIILNEKSNIIINMDFGDRNDTESDDVYHGKWYVYRRHRLAYWETDDFFGNNGIAFSKSFYTKTYFKKLRR